LIEIRNRGWFFRRGWRLTVGRRDKSKLARNMGRQVDAVRATLEAAGIDPLPPITPVLCFVDGRWPWFRLRSSGSRGPLRSSCQRSSPSVSTGLACGQSRQ
jgi:hypothetical protein